MPLDAFQRIQTELAQVFEQLPEAAVAQTVQAIRTHKRIFVSAAGRSGLMLKAFAMRLMQAGFTAYAAGETTTPAIGPGDLLIVASASGQTPSVCRNAEIARAAGADLWVISGKDASPLARLQPPQVLLRAPDKNAASAAQVMGSLFEQALLLFGDCVVQALEADPAAMRARHANLE